MLEPKLQGVIAVNLAFKIGVHARRSVNRVMVSAPEIELYPDLVHSEVLTRWQTKAGWQRHPSWPRTIQ